MDYRQREEYEMFDMKRACNLFLKLHLNSKNIKNTTDYTVFVILNYQVDKYLNI